MKVMMIFKVDMKKHNKRVSVHLLTSSDEQYKHPSSIHIKDNVTFGYQNLCNKVEVS